MWTRPQIADFKEKIRQDADSVITVGRGEVVTVRVPTHEEGSYLFWEFATDNYDIGFGVYFEWTDSPNTAVSVHVSESSEDEDEDEGILILYKLELRLRHAQVCLILYSILQDNTLIFEEVKIWKLGCCVLGKVWYEEVPTQYGLVDLVHKKPIAEGLHADHKHANKLRTGIS